MDSLAAPVLVVEAVAAAALFALVSHRLKASVFFRFRYLLKTFRFQCPLQVSVVWVAEWDKDLDYSWDVVLVVAVAEQPGAVLTAGSVAI
jgi:hypothetical protein